MRCIADRTAVQGSMFKVNFKILLIFYIFKKSSGSIPACLRMALSVPSGISPE
jgi:hypothetical protein